MLPCLLVSAALSLGQAEATPAPERQGDGAEEELGNQEIAIGEEDAASVPVPAPEDRQVVVEADEALPYTSVGAALTACREAGVNEIALASRTTP